MDHLSLRPDSSRAPQAPGPHAASRPPHAWSEEDILLALFDGDDPPAALRAVWQSAGASRLIGRGPAELIRGFGLGASVAGRVAAACELQRRWCLRARRPPARIRSGTDVVSFLEPRLAGCRTECFWVLCLDAQGGLLHEERISLGTLTASLVHPREVFAPAVLHRAAAVVVAHNHPSGDPTPSEEDRATTRRLQRAGRLLGIELLDHLVVGDEAFRSFLEEGWL